MEQLINALIEENNNQIAQINRITHVVDVHAGVIQHQGIGQQFIVNDVRKLHNDVLEQNKESQQRQITQGKEAEHGFHQVNSPQDGGTRVVI